ncbi:MAG: hypothetical protein AB8F95_06600 [Bacteroidia bacterium]
MRICLIYTIGALFCASAAYAQQRKMPVVDIMPGEIQMLGIFNYETPSSWRNDGNVIGIQGAGGVSVQGVPLQYQLAFNTSHHKIDNPVNIMRLQFDTKRFLSQIQQQMLAGKRSTVWREQLQGWQLAQKAQMMEQLREQGMGMSDSMIAVFEGLASELEQIDRQLEQECFAGLEKRWEQARQQYGNLDDSLLLNRALDNLEQRNSKAYHELKGLQKLKKLKQQLLAQRQRAESLAGLFASQKDLKAWKNVLSKDHRGLLTNAKVLKKAGLISNLEALLTRIQNFSIGQISPYTSDFTLGGVPVRGVDFSAGNENINFRIIHGNSYGRLQTIGKTDTLNLGGKVTSASLKLRKGKSELGFELVQKGTDSLSSQKTIGACTASTSLLRDRLTIQMNSAFTPSQDNIELAGVQGEIAFNHGIHKASFGAVYTDKGFVNPLSPWLISGQTQYQGAWELNMKRVRTAVFAERQLDRSALIQNRFLWLQQFGFEAQIQPFKKPSLNLKSRIAPQIYQSVEGDEIINRNSTAFTNSIGSECSFGTGDIYMEARHTGQYQDQESFQSMGGSLGIQGMGGSNLTLSLDYFGAEYFPGLDQSWQGAITGNVQLLKALALQADVQILQGEEPLRWGGSIGASTSFGTKTPIRLQLLYRQTTFNQAAPQITTEMQNQTGLFINLSIQPFTR